MTTSKTVRQWRSFVGESISFRLCTKRVTAVIEDVVPTLSVGGINVELLVRTQSGSRLQFAPEAVDIE